MKYADQLRDPRWQKKRLRIFDRDGWRCLKCGNDKEQLHVHHPKYRGRLMAWEYEDNELETVCNTCHHKEHFPTAEAAPKFIPPPILQPLVPVIRGIAITWCEWGDGIGTGDIAGWSGERLRENHPDKDEIYVCADLGGRELLMDGSAACVFLFPGKEEMTFAEYRAARDNPTKYAYWMIEMRSDTQKKGLL